MISRTLNYSKKATFSGLLRSLSTYEANEIPIPARNDTLRVLVSGVIIKDPLERTIPKIGNFSVRFTVAVTGHFEAAHDWEKSKPASTTWINGEMWNEEAKAALPFLKRGSTFAGVGTMMTEQWVGKEDGMKRSKMVFRCSKLLSKDSFDNIVNQTDGAVAQGSGPNSAWDTPTF